ncbi:MAG: hypothetical protein Q9159_007179 [Coniocarpon cinnabarinum]
MQNLKQYDHPSAPIEPSHPPPFSFHSRPPHPQPPPPVQTSAPPSNTSPTAHTGVGPPSSNFDVIDWSRAYASCQRYFLDHGQHEAGTQAMAALINILLPFQWRQSPIFSSCASQNTSQHPYQTATPPHTTDPAHHHTDAAPNRAQTSTPTEPQDGLPYYFPPTSQASTNSSAPPLPQTSFVSLIPYIRRMLITGYAVAPALYGVFGSDYNAGILPLVEVERRNYLFTAKSVGWAGTKREYDMPDGQAVPFLRPLEDVKGPEVGNAEREWGRWMRGMEDWEVEERGPVQPGRGHEGVSQRGSEGSRSMRRGYGVADEMGGSGGGVEVRRPGMRRPREDSGVAEGGVRIKRERLDDE